MWPFHHFLFPSEHTHPYSTRSSRSVFCCAKAPPPPPPPRGVWRPTWYVGFGDAAQGWQAGYRIVAAQGPVTQPATEATHTTIHTYIHTYFMFRFLSTQVERLRESFSPSKTNPKKKTKTKTNQIGCQGRSRQEQREEKWSCCEVKAPKRQNREAGHGEREQEDLHEQAQTKPKRTSGLGPCP